MDEGDAAIVALDPTEAEAEAGKARTMQAAQKARAQASDSD